MSGIIKSGTLADLSSVRPLAGSSMTAASFHSKSDEERDRLHRRIAMLEKELGQRDAAIRGLRKDVERALEEGKEKGRIAGLAEAQDRQAERLSALATCLRGIQDEISRKLISLERLAPLLARECLEKVLGDPDCRAEIVQAILQAYIREVDKSMLVSIEVSRLDFPDDAALTALVEEIGARSVAVTASGDRRSGDCVVTLRVGQMEIGINQQWPALRALLEDIALPGAAE